MEEQRKRNSYEIEVEEKREQTKLCITLVWRNTRRETVMKQKLKKRNGTNEVMQYSCMEEQKNRNSYEIEVEEGKQNRRSYVVLLYGGTQEEKQL